MSEPAAEDWVQRARRFLSRDLWRTEIAPGTLTAAAVRLLQVSVMIGRGFVQDQLLLRAAGLTYMTLLSLVPLLAVSFSIVNAMGVSEDLVELAVDTIAGGSPQAKATMIDLVHGANIRGMGTVGAGILVITTVLALRQIEETFNHIWGVRSSRGWMRRFTDYLAVVVVAPLLAGMAISLGTSLQADPLLDQVLEISYMHSLYDWGLQQMPTVFLTLAFTFLYWFFPNTDVRIGPALAGGVLSALLFSMAQDLYVQFNIGVARADKLFGAFSALPLFMAWNYLSWAIVLLGAELSFAVQNLSLYRREVRGRAPGPAEREAAGLRIAVEIARAFRDGTAARNSEQLADTLQLSIRTVREILQLLSGARIVIECADDRDHAYALGRPADRILVSDVLDCVRGARESEPTESSDPASAAVNDLLDELGAASEEISRRRSLSDVIKGLPAPKEEPD